MSDFRSTRDAVLQLYVRLESTARDRGADVTVGRLIAGRERLEQGRLVVVVCGEFKRGKSSLLNALLHDSGDMPLFPEATEIATNVVTTVSYGDQEKITVVVDVPDGDPEVIEIGRADIAEYVTESGNPRNSRRARLIEIQTPNPRLSSGLTLVDTPGVGGLYAEHTAATMAFLPSADAIVFVTDATQPLLESEIRFLRRAIESLSVVDSPDALQFVLTKIDIGEYETILDNTRSKLAGLLQQPAGRVVVTPVSAHAMRDYLRGGDPEDLELSNFPLFESVLWTGLNRWQAKRLLGAALQDQERALQSLLQPLDTELAALADDTKRQVAELARQAEDRQRRLTEKLSAKSGWRFELGQAVSRVGHELNSHGQQGMDQGWHRCLTEYLEDDSYLSAPDRLVGQMQADAVAVIGEVNELAARRLADVLAEFSSRSRLDMEVPELDRLPEPPVPTVTVTGMLGQQHQPAKVKRKLRDMTFGGGLGSGIGTIVGSMLTPLLGPAGIAIGTALGNLVGATLGYRSGIKDEANFDRQRRRASLQTELVTIHRQHGRHVTDAVTAMIRSYTEALVAELESRIAAEQESVTDLIARLADARMATQAKAKTRTAELTAQRTPLITMRSTITALARAVDDLSRASAPLVTAGTIPADAHPNTSSSAGGSQPEPPAVPASNGSWADE